MQKTLFALLTFLALLPLAGGTSFTLMGAERWALLVGISQYPRSEKLTDEDWGEIHGANDVVLLKEALMQQGFTPTHILTLTNAEAKAEAIRQTLREIMNNLQTGDMLYLHFSCHGQLMEDLTGDETDGWDEALVPYDAQKCYRQGIYEGTNHLCDDELNHFLRQLRQRLGPTGMLYVALDACHIGEAYMYDSYFRGTNQVFTPHGKKYVKAEVVRHNRRHERPIEPCADLANICMLEACRAYELNMEKRVEGQYYGSLSYYIARALSSLSIDPQSLWWQHVRQQLDNDAALINQHLVIESSL